MKIFLSRSNQKWDNEAHSFTFSVNDYNHSRDFDTNISSRRSKRKDSPWLYDRYLSSSTVKMMVDNHHGKIITDYMSPEAIEDFQHRQMLETFRTHPLWDDFWNVIVHYELEGSSRLDITNILQNTSLILLLTDMMNDPQHPIHTHVKKRYHHNVLKIDILQHYIDDISRNIYIGDEINLM